MAGKSFGKGKGKFRVRPNQPAGKRNSFPWINSQIITASETGDLNYLLTTIMNHMSAMNLVNLSTALHRLAKLAANDQKMQEILCADLRLEELLSTIGRAFTCCEPEQVQPQSISNVVWSLATVRYARKPLLQVVAQMTMANINEFKPFELSTTLWALAKLHGVDTGIAGMLKPVFPAAASFVTQNVSAFGFRCLATVAWAFATARQRHARLFRTVALQMTQMAASANCQEMANTAWAYGTADFHDDQLFQHLAEQASHKLEEFKPQELSNILWGFATNGFFHEAFFAKASKVAQKMNLQAQHLANMIWAFARVRPRHQLTQETIFALLPTCSRLLQTFKPQEVSSTALAVAKALAPSEDDVKPEVYTELTLGKEVHDFFQNCLPWIASRLRDFSAQSLANTVSAYVMVPIKGSPLLFDAIANEVMRRSKNLDQTAVVHLLKAFVSVPDSPVCVAVTQHLAADASKHVYEMRPQELSTLARLIKPVAQRGQGVAGHMKLPDASCEEVRAWLLEMACSTEGPEKFLQEGVPDMVQLVPSLPGPVLRTPSYPIPMPLGPTLEQALFLTPEEVERPWLDPGYASVERPWSESAYHVDQVGDKPWIEAGYSSPIESLKARKGITNRKQKRAEQNQEDQSHPPLCTINEAGISANYSHAPTQCAAPAWLGEEVVAIPPVPLSAAHPAQAIPFGPTELAASVAIAAYPARHVGYAASQGDNPFKSYQTQMKNRRKKDGEADKRRWSVKNSFLHLEDESGSEPEDDSFDGTSSQGGKSSQRSSSAPPSTSKVRLRL